MVSSWTRTEDLRRGPGGEGLGGTEEEELSRFSPPSTAFFFMTPTTSPISSSSLVSESSSSGVSLMTSLSSSKRRLRSWTMRSSSIPDALTTLVFLSVLMIMLSGSWTFALSPGSMNSMLRGAFMKLRYVGVSDEHSHGALRNNNMAPAPHLLSIPLLGVS